MSISPRVLSALTEQFLANYVPGVVRARVVCDDETAAPHDIYIDVAAGNDPAFVSRAVQVVMTDRFMMPVPPHHIHLRQTDEPQLRADAERLKKERPDIEFHDNTPELDALMAAKAAGTDDEGTFEFQRLRASAWYSIREGYSEAEDQETLDTTDEGGEEDQQEEAAAIWSETGEDPELRQVPDENSDESFEAQRDAILNGDLRTLIVAHPTIRDALVSGLLELFRDSVLAPARKAGQDFIFLQDTIFSEWLILAAERLGLPSQPFDDFPEDPHGIGPAVAAAIAPPIPIDIAPSIAWCQTATIDQRRKAMRDAVLGMVALEDHVIQPAFHGRYDPLAAEAMLLVAWLSLAAEHAGVPPDQIEAAIPVEGEVLDAIMDAAATALEQQCVDRGLVEALDA